MRTTGPALLSAAIAVSDLVPTDASASPQTRAKPRQHDPSVAQSARS
jgi:hypothetical protein